MHGHVLTDGSILMLSMQLLITIMTQLSLLHYATGKNKAKRPIIEFYPNLKLFDAGTDAKAPVDFIDTRTTNAFDQVANQKTILS